MSDLIRILIVDDHPIMRLGIAAMIATQIDMRVVGQAQDVRDGIAAFDKHRPDLTIVDLRLPGESGVELIRSITNKDKRAAILVLTTYEGDEDIFQAIQAGARGYLIKGMSQDSLVEGIRTVHQGRRYLPVQVRNKLSARMSHSELSEREMQVLHLLAMGLSNKAIGLKLGVTEATVKSHVGMILAALEVEDRTQAVLAAIRRGHVHID